MFSQRHRRRPRHTWKEWSAWSVFHEDRKGAGRVEGGGDTLDSSYDHDASWREARDDCREIAERDRQELEG